MNFISRIFCTALLISWGTISVPNNLKNSSEVNHISVPQLCNPEAAFEQIIQPDEFHKTVRRFLAVTTLTMALPSKWLNNNSILFKDSGFRPFVQKKIIPDSSEVAFFGDLHGNIQSLSKILAHLYNNQIINDNFRIIKDNFYMVFLGDYVDRGDSGIEVLYTIMRLKIANPQKVFLIRGNHEDKHLNNYFGFAEELETKLKSLSQEDRESVYKIYNMMPVALYLGTVNKESNVDYVQCCHGGIEPGYLANDLLEDVSSAEYEYIQTLTRADVIRSLPSKLKRDVMANVPSSEFYTGPIDKPTAPVALGLLWHDFICDQTSDSSIVNFEKNRGWLYGKDLTRYFLKKQSGSDYEVHAIIRGHQHYGSMLKQLIANKGLVNLWNGTVYTVLSAPIHGLGFEYTTFTLLNCGKKFSDWKINTTVI
jgi:hypothetical protein